MTVPVLGKQVVPRRVYNPAVMLVDQGEHDLLVCLKGLDGCRLVIAHQATVTHDIGA